MEEPVKQQPTIQSITRAIAILRCFEGSRELRLTEISGMMGLHKSTTAGIIHTLKVERFLEQNAQTGKYRLGIDLFNLAANARLELDEICAPYLDELLEMTGETVNLAVRDGLEIVYVAKKESPHSIRISTAVGKRLPLYCTAIGKAILASLPETESEAILDSTELQAFTSKTVTDKAKLMQMLCKIRKEGVSYDVEELQDGLICIAVPILYKQHYPLGAISVSGPSGRMGQEARKAIARKLIAAAKRICDECLRVLLP